jgi:hypothetical protein
MWSSPGLIQPPSGAVWDQAELAHNFHIMTLTPPPTTEWYMDSGASSHMASNSGILSHVFCPNSSTPSSIIVGNGSLMPVTSTSHTYFPSIDRPLFLYDVLVSHDIIKNLIFVRRFTTDNLVSIEFDPFGLSVKDLQTKNVIVRCNSSGQLYPLFPSADTSTPQAFLMTVESSTIWHCRLAHLSDDAFSILARSSAISCNKFDHLPLCHACQLGRHTRLPFSTSRSRASQNFDLIHCDLWTSPVASISGYKYYLVILDDCSHFVWTFPLKFKSDTFSTLANFFSFVSTQFSRTIKSVQCDNGCEFDNSSSRTFFLTHGVTLCMSCSYTSQQNGKAERILRTLNNIARSLVFQASFPPSYWVEALHTATYLLNRRPSKTLSQQTPYAALHGSPPSYDHLRVFGCKCYPNTSATATHKLAPRSSLCVFLGYSENHKGYRCLDLDSNCLIISRHVVFDESSFPFAEKSNSLPSSNFDFLSEFHAMSLSIKPCFSSRDCAETGSTTASTPTASGIATRPRPAVVPVSQALLPSEAPDPVSPGWDELPPASRGSPPGPLLMDLHTDPDESAPDAAEPMATGPDTPSGSATATTGSGSTPAPAIPGVLCIPPVQNDHAMVTRGKHGFRQPKERLNLHAATLSPLPKTYRGALANPN